MRALRPTVLGLSLALAGCAAALPGYSPPSKARDRLLAAQQTGGGFDESGAYSLTDQEQKLDCKHLTGSMTVKILQMREARDRRDPSLAASTAQAAWKPFKGGTDYGLNTSEDLRRDRVRLETFNGKLAEKGCRTFDLDTELAPGNTATPTPVGTDASRKKG